MTDALKQTGSSSVSHRKESHAPEPSGVRQVYPNVSHHSYLPVREVQDA
ncbi:hypothetical protein L861_01790 [Litchfieldella anticariensis FP35 = DSM 16096]|uniref:Uncharacterized protein n=1 Tax=Litchfieldella anticariensis (strain DSM 16096 / CECT 5854 / CIP 108499 / LMG 22089 / FP35) TaxID=1121939 RepID=S2KU20_LITA3|nr:hypothetical protein [Halomonas anticariensis]EPC04063.1 hypothetical protein L861_01790 [Halomonas anticariensis FP35 = DSM 16096]